MVLYQLHHPVFFRWILTHRLTENKHKKAFLLVGGVSKLVPKAYLGQNFPNVTRFTENSCFDEVLFYGSEPKGGNTVEEVEATVISHFDSLFKKNNIDLDSFEQIISTVDAHNSFGIYLSLKRLKFYLQEDLDNRFYTQRQNTAYTLKSATIAYNETMKKHGASCAENPLIIPIFRPNSQNPFGPEREYCVFDDIKKIDEIAFEDRQKIILDMEVKFDFPKGGRNALMALRSMAPIQELFKVNPYIKTLYVDVFLTYLLAYQLSLDYYVKDEFELIIKGHPSKQLEIGLIEKYFNTKHMIPSGFPIEFIKFLPEYEDKIIDLYLGFSSTSDSTLKSMVKENIIVSRGTFYIFYLYHRLFTIFKFVQLNCSKKNIVFSFGVWSEHATNFQRHVFQNINCLFFRKMITNISDESIYVIDESRYKKDRLFKMLTDSPIDSIVFLLNRYDNFDLSDPLFSEIINNFTTITITKTAIKEADILDHMKNETFFVYSKNLDFLNSVRQFSFEKILSYTGIEIRVNSLEN